MKSTFHVSHTCHSTERDKVSRLLGEGVSSAGIVATPLPPRDPSSAFALSSECMKPYALCETCETWTRVSVTFHSIFDAHAPLRGLLCGFYRSSASPRSLMHFKMCGNVLLCQHDVPHLKEGTSALLQCARVHGGFGAATPSRLVRSTLHSYSAGFLLRRGASLVGAGLLSHRRHSVAAIAVRTG